MTSRMPKPEIDLAKVTAAQYLRAKDVSERFHNPFDITEWTFIPFTDGAIGHWFKSALGGEIFIGIEKDGYAHS